MQTAKELSAALGLKTTDHVYANVEAYGGMRLGTGPRAPLRFPPTDQALDNMRRAQQQQRARPGVTRGRPGPKPKRKTTAATTPLGSPMLTLP